MILGRNAGLWAALVQSALNVAAAVVVVVTGASLSPADVALFAALNAFGLAIVGVIANASDPTTVPTFARMIGPAGASTPGPSPASAGPATAAPSGDGSGASSTSGPSGDGSALG